MKSKIYTKIIVLLLLAACAKEPHFSQVTDSSIHFDEYIGKYIKEIIITSGDNDNNYAFFRVIGENEQHVIDYLASHSLRLFKDIKVDDIFEIELDIAKNGIKPNEIIDDEIFGQEIIIELVTASIVDENNRFYLEVKKNGYKFPYEFNTLFTTTGSFLGLVLYENRYIHYQPQYRSCYLCFWEHGAIWPLGSSSLMYTWLNRGSNYKIGLRVYSHQTTDYYIAYNHENFRGSECSIGTWDTRNCYVGTPPSGTTAFMYPDNRGTFYYTPVNGNQCPLPGSWFDQHHCSFVNIPGEETYGFIWNNMWYVKGNKIF